MIKKVSIAAAAALALTGAAAAGTTVLDIDLAGWEAHGGYGNLANSSMTFNVPVGTEILSAEYIDLTYETFGFSWNSELVLSLNDTPGFVSYWDSQIAGAGNNAGVFGPVSETFANSPNAGGPFTMTTEDLYVETYAAYTGGVDDYHVISAGTLRITMSAIPAPGAMALLGVAGLVGTRRRRSA